MTTRDLIEKELSELNEEDLSELYRIIQSLKKTKRYAYPPSLMSKLKLIKINAPPDFSSNLDLYMSGEKIVQ